VTPTLGARLRRVLRALRMVVGAPDYDGYLAHLSAHHPERTPLSREEFERSASERRARPGARCC
jgi:uncharacterized short protein YbdD (DUF466 family)